jgi:hypothetical protein
MDNKEVVKMLRVASSKWYDSPISFEKTMENLIKENNLEPIEFVKGEMYKSKGNQLAIFQDRHNGYGFQVSGDYNNCYHFSIKDNWTEATEEDKEKFGEMLIAEGLRKYPIGTEVVSFFGPNHYAKIVNDKDNHNHLDSHGNLWMSGDVCNLIVFRKGKWSEILEERNVNNASNNFIEEVKEDYKKNPSRLEKDLTSIALNSKFTLAEIKETYRAVEDVEELSLIIRTAQKTALEPREIISLIKDFDKWTK